MCLCWTKVFNFPSWLLFLTLILMSSSSGAVNEAMMTSKSKQTTTIKNYKTEWNIEYVTFFSHEELQQFIYESSYMADGFRWYVSKNWWIFADFQQTLTTYLDHFQSTTKPNKNYHFCIFSSISLTGITKEYWPKTFWGN